MKLTPVITYSDIYSGQVPDINILLSEISLNDILFCLSYINAQITNEKDNLIQFNLLGKFLKSFSVRESEFILNKLRPLFEKNKDSIIFNSFTNMSLMDYAFLIKGSLKQEVKIKPKNEADFFQAYLIFSDNLFNSDKLINNSNLNNDELSFQKLTWPIMKGQMQFAIAYEKDYLLFRLAVFFNYFKIDKYATYLDNYASKFGKVSYWEIIFRLIEIYSFRYKKDSNNSFLYLINLDQNDSLLEHLCIDVDSYQTSWKHNFDLIKSKPLYKIDNNKFLVLNWDYLGNQLYLGTLFDFYNNSGISDLFVKLPDFLSIVGEKITEKIFFKKLIQHSFAEKHIVKAFDEDYKSNGLPDGYVRDNKSIYLFEMKDNLIGSDLIINGDYKDIERVLMEKFYKSKNKKDDQKKGVKQLLSTIRNLADNKYSFDKNLIISKTKLYPIIIYTDSFCSMYGVNDYLNQLFQEERKKMVWNENFKLSDLTLISLETMFKHMQNFRTREFKLNRMIDDYHKYILNSKNKNINQHVSFDIFINDSKYKSFRSENFVSEALSCFDLKTDFPSDTNN